MVTGVAAAAIVILSDFVAACAVGVVESITFMVKPNVPEAVGVPEIAPVEAFRLSPGGNEDEISDQLYGVVPPPANTAALYAVFCRPFGNDVVVIVTGVTDVVTVMLSDLVAV
jgi:hypothetical protein